VKDPSKARPATAGLAGHQPTGDGQHLLLAAGEGAAKLAAPLAQARKTLEAILHVLLDCGFVFLGKGAHLQVFHYRQCGKDFAAFGDLDDSLAHDLIGEALVRSSPLKRIEPERGLSRPEIVLRVVLLPAPFAPIKATISPFST